MPLLIRTGSQIKESGTAWVPTAESLEAHTYNAKLAHFKVINSKHLSQNC